ncbi:MAG: retroviral-like aspartic protease family protein [gamma proteobacterium symbiont of Bathyaustriella thionipta]|nr:retroviral-like aspartic protease family protein [gamma proteobacterium symbiont of Bathyaustriella thionipta]MCU7950984.1 retroviral-like aspartic protease family protein [gamma proteobacterium symbiont of Bathyaustriella thionipta]MCU7954878.1 retroviral-like aspartic protease family protein [gamma proteobacterium symbiont of Bathyaustriella thionipta]MCU7957486.1 retroviral-like aspartic protease family protein [gamma proteobacterium symbiont of Bathyaustriella thionipta]MCU7968418.1 retr
MLNQQYKFAIIFIGLGALLGWFTHIAYNEVINKERNADISPVNRIQTNIINISSKQHKQDEFNLIEKRFIALIMSEKYENALLLYRDIKPDNQLKLDTILLSQIHDLNNENNPNVFKLLDVFLQEYYNNTQLLVIKANSLRLNNEQIQALDAFLLAKNYAKNNEDYMAINKAIHNFAHVTYNHFKEKNDWPQSVEFFKKLIENEPDFPFYHLSLAESYIRLGDKESAKLPLQWVKDDVIYGDKATELLEMMTLNDLPMGIELEKKGNQYITKATLSNYYDTKLLIDTGASYSSLPSYIIAQLVVDQQAEKLQISQLKTAGGIIQVNLYRLKKMTIGNFSVNDIIVTELNLESLQDIKNDFEGLLGMNFLSHFEFSIDLQSNQLFLTPKFN